MKKVLSAYSEDGVQYRFDDKAFHVQVNRKKYDDSVSGKKTTKAAIMQELADKLSISTDAIKNWLYGQNGPSDLEQVKGLGRYLGIDYHQLLVMEERDMSEIKEVSAVVKKDSQEQFTKERVRAIYQAMLQFIRRCKYYYFSDINPDSDGDPFNPEFSRNLERANGELSGYFDGMVNVLENSMLDVPEQIYNRFYDYMWMDLNDYIDLVTEKAKDQSEYEEIAETMSLDEYFQMEEDKMHKYFSGGYMKELKELFADYMVN